MKKAIVALALAGFASSAMAQIATSVHDLSGGYASGLPAAGTAQLSSCQFCHAPHYGNTSSPTGIAADGYQNIPLWNRNTPTAAIQATYQRYTNVVSAVAYGVGTFTCLSCHDGSSDIGDTFRGTKGFAESVAGDVTMALVPANIGGTWNGATNAYVPSVGAPNFTDDHPVGVTYTGDGTNGYATAANVQAGADGLHLYPQNGGLSVECGSCHDPHTPGTGGKFLRKAATAICSTCHLK